MYAYYYEQQLPYRLLHWSVNNRSTEKTNKQAPLFLAQTKHDKNSIDARSIVTARSRRNTKRVHLTALNGKTLINIGVRNARKICACM